MRAQLEKIIPPSDASFVVDTLVLPTPFDGLLHYHPEIEIILIVDGNGERLVGDDFAPFGPHELAIMGSNLPHFWRGKRGAEGTIRKVILIQFATEIFGDSLFKAPEFAKVRIMLQRAQRGLLFNQKNSAAVQKKVMEISTAKGWKRYPLLVEILGMLSDIETGKALSSPKFSSQTSNYSADRIGRAMKYITDNFARPLTLGDVSKEVSMSPSAFCRYFHKTTGKHLTKFINDVRLGHACQLLRETHLQIKDICFQSGFGTLSSFNKVFRDVKGMTPGKFRKAIR